MSSETNDCRLIPELSDLPNEVLCEIAAKLNLKSRLNLRKASQRFRQVVDLPASHIKSLSIRINCGFLQFQLDDVSYICYQSDSDNCRVDCSGSQGPTTTQISGNYLEIALNDLATLLQPASVRIEDLSFEIHVSASLETSQRVIEVFHSRKRQIQAKSVSMSVTTSDQVLSILSALKPEYLESIRVHTPQSENLTDIVKTDQFRKARKVEVSCFIDSAILHHFCHLNSFVIYRVSIVADDIIRVRDQLLLSKNFKNCRILFHHPLNPTEIRRALGLRGAEGSFLSELYQVPSGGFLLQEISMRGYISFTWIH